MASFPFTHRHPGTSIAPTSSEYPEPFPSSGTRNTTAVGTCWLRWRVFSDPRSNSRRHQVCPIFTICEVNDGGDQFDRWQSFASADSLCRASLCNFITFTVQGHKHPLWYRIYQGGLQKLRLQAWWVRERLHTDGSTDEEIWDDELRSASSQPGSAE